MTKSAIIACAGLLTTVATDNFCPYDASDQLAIAYAMCDRISPYPYECYAITQRWLDPSKETNFDADLMFIKFVAGPKE